jgi:hypothetical protein
MPELDLTFDLPDFELPLEAIGGSSIMSPISMASKQSSQQWLAEKEVEEEEPALAVSSGAPSIGAGVSDPGLGFAHGISSVRQPPGPSFLEEDSGIVDVGWEFDENGEMVDTVQAARPTTTWPPNEDVTGGKMKMDSALMIRARGGSSDDFWASQQVRSF